MQVKNADEFIFVDFLARESEHRGHESTENSIESTRFAEHNRRAFCAITNGARIISSDVQIHRRFSYEKM